MTSIQRLVDDYQAGVEAVEDALPGDIDPEECDAIKKAAISEYEELVRTLRTAERWMAHNADYNKSSDRAVMKTVRETIAKHKEVAT